MREPLILAVDQGTTNTKALLVCRSGRPVFRVSESLTLIHGHNGFIEQDPEELWQCVSNVIDHCSAYANQTGAEIVGIAISNQRETALAWSGRTGESLGNAISWQCSRSSELCDRLRPSADMIRRKTGLPLAPLMSAGKWGWLLEQHPEWRDLASSIGAVCLGTVDSWLIHRLTGGTVHCTDLSNASRTGLLNLESLLWDEELLNLFGIPSWAMPRILPSSGPFGLATVIPNMDAIPIIAVLGDSHAALLGHGSYRAGTIKATYGTGSSLMALTASLAPDSKQLARTIAWSTNEHTQYALEGNIAMTGSAVQWVGEFLGLPHPTSDVVALAKTVPDAAGVYFVPAMVGLGAPHWDCNARGTVSGLGRAHTAAHLARAALDSIGYQVADAFFAIEAAIGHQLPSLRVDGGASRNDALMQFQANMLGKAVLRSSDEELSALGAAWLGGLTLGWWKSFADLQSLAQTPDVFEPASDPDKDLRYDGWRLAMQRTLMREQALS